MTELPFGLGTVSPFFAGVLATIGAYFAFKLLNSARKTFGSVIAAASIVVALMGLLGPETVLSWIGI